MSEPRTFYSPSRRGFFRDDIHPTIPDDALAITDAQHRALLDAQAAGKMITPGADGLPVAIDRPAPTGDALAARVRAERNRLLAASDWTQVPDSPADGPQWLRYRQALRQITLQQGFPHDVTWPTPPG